MIAIRTTPWSRAWIGPELSQRLAEIRGPVGTPVAGWLSLSARTPRGPFAAQYTGAARRPITIERPNLSDAVETVLAFAEMDR